MLLASIIITVVATETALFSLNPLNIVLAFAFIRLGKTSFSTAALVHRIIGLHRPSPPPHAVRIDTVFSYTCRRRMSCAEMDKSIEMPFGGRLVWAQATLYYIEMQVSHEMGTQWDTRRSTVKHRKYTAEMRPFTKLHWPHVLARQPRAM